MHATVPVRFGRRRLDSLGNKGLAAYLIINLNCATFFGRTLLRSFASRRKVLRSRGPPRATPRAEFSSVVLTGARKTTDVIYTSRGQE